MINGFELLNQTDQLKKHIEQCEAFFNYCKDKPIFNISEHPPSVFVVKDTINHLKEVIQYIENKMEQKDDDNKH